MHADYTPAAFPFRGDPLSPDVVPYFATAASRYDYTTALVAYRASDRDLTAARAAYNEARNEGIDGEAARTLREARDAAWQRWEAAAAAVREATRGTAWRRTYREARGPGGDGTWQIDIAIHVARYDGNGRADWQPVRCLAARRVTPGAAHYGGEWEVFELE